MNSKIPVTCRGADNLSLNALECFQGSLKKITQSNLEKLKRRIVRDGINVPIFVWKNGEINYILDGHQRLKALNSLKDDGYDIPKIPVAYIEAEDAADARQKLLGITSQFGEFEIEELDDWLKEMDADLADTLRMVNDEIKMIPEVSDDDADPQFDIAEKLREKWGVETGQIWQLGKHRILCGDSRKPDDVAKVMDGNKCDLVFTDPPYGVFYADKNKYLNTISRGNRIQTPIKGDHEKPENVLNLWTEVFKTWSAFHNEYSSYYVCAPQGGDLLLMMMMMNENNHPLKHTIVWSKNNHVLGRCDYMYKHEPLLYGWQHKHKFYGRGKQKFSVWNFDKPLKNDLHPTMKPVNLIINAILNSTEKDMIVVDYFLGSGSTLIACENTDRKCRAIEIDPGYVAVSIQRWVDATGKEPELLY